MLMFATLVFQNLAVLLPSDTLTRFLFFHTRANKRHPNETKHVSNGQTQTNVNVNESISFGGITVAHRSDYGTERQR
jgi:hypothetical protein